MESEEGEIHDASPDYEPLQRPTITYTQVPIRDSSDDSSLEEGELCIPKRQKFAQVQNAKYNVWSDCTDDLLLSLDNISMTNLDRSRNVENYSYKRPYDCSSHGSHSSLETSIGESHYRRQKFPKHQRRRYCKSGTNKEKVRVLSDLNVTPSDPDEIVAKDITKKLCEPNNEIILNVVTVLGAEKAIEVYYETQSIEQSGGLLVIDRSRRRTSGGVYLYLIRRDDKIPTSQKSLIFDDIKSLKRSKSLKRKRVKRHTDTSYKDIGEKEKPPQEHEVLENPPPSPATETDPFIIIPLNRPPSPQIDSGIEKMDVV